MRHLPLFVLLISTPLLNGCPVVIATGVATGVVTGQDRRTLGTITEDQGIELKAQQRINQKYPDPHINVTAYNRMVLLTGEAPDETTRSGIEAIARAVENVRGAYNEIAVAGNSSHAARANDSLLTTKVKTRFIDENKFNPIYVKVVSENGIVYLLGLVKHSEADAAVEIARTTSGVRKVVTLFEYLD